MRERKLKIGGRYKHYKGNFYEVIGLARHGDDPDQEFVVYRALYDSPEFGLNQIWVRPKSVFLEKISRDGKTFYRFRETKE